MKALRTFAALSVILFSAFFPVLFPNNADAACVTAAESATIAAAALPTPAGETPTVTVLETCSGDDTSYAIPITATVTFDNHQYATVYATTNSVITFGAPDGTYWAYPNTPSISLYSMDWLSLPSVHPDEHLIISSSDGGFQVDLSARPYGQYGVTDPTNIIITAAINQDGTVAMSYVVTGPTYDGQTRTGVRLTDGNIVTLEQYGVQQVTVAPTLAPTPEPTPVPSTSPTSTPEPVVTPTATPEPIPSPTLTPEPSPSATPTPSDTPQPTPTPTTPVETPTPEPSPTPSTSLDPVVVPTPSPTPTPVVTPSPTPTPVPTQEPRPIPQPLPAPLPTPEPVPAPAPTPEPSPTPVPSENPNTPEQPAPVPPLPPVEVPVTPLPPEPGPTPAPPPPEPMPAPEPSVPPAPVPEPTPVQPQPPTPVQPPVPAPVPPTPPVAPIPNLIPNNPNSLPKDTPLLPPTTALVPHVQEDKKGVENGGINFFGTQSAPQVVGEDGKLTPPAPPPGSGLPIPPEAITTTDTFIGQVGGTTFNAPDVAVPVIEQSVTGAMAAVPGVQALNHAFVAMENIGNDMSPVTRKKAKKILVITVALAAMGRRFK